MVIAFVLAFLFRTFEAEAFVIPTGSMAPTLMGRHKDLVCPKCGCPYQVSASEEVDRKAAIAKDADVEIEAGTCPMCRYTAELGPDNPQHQSYPSYNGDRILVGKFAYEFADPQRWDVIVFKFPGDARPTPGRITSSGLVGLPGETVRIQARRHVDSRRTRQRRRGFQHRAEAAGKAAGHAPAGVRQRLHAADRQIRLAGALACRTDPPPAARPELGVPTTTRRFTPTARPPARTGCATTISCRPTAVGGGRATGGSRQSTLAPQLITDFTAYDTSRDRGETRTRRPTSDSLGLYWVGDLAVAMHGRGGKRQGRVALRAAQGRTAIPMPLRRGHRPGGPLDQRPGHGGSFSPTAATSVRGPGRHEIRFSNCDNELLLVGRRRAWSSSMRRPRYDDLGNTLPEASDLSPVGVASVGVKARLSHLAIFRDIYYIADDMSYPRPATTLRLQRPVRATKRRRCRFPLKADQFFVLGDNSARSQDGRLWGPIITGSRASC